MLNEKKKSAYSKRNWTFIFKRLEIDCQTIRDCGFIIREWETVF